MDLMDVHFMIKFFFFGSKIKQAGDMPPWMRLLHSKMSSPQSAVNIKLFIARLIINCPKVLE